LQQNKSLIPAKKTTIIGRSYARCSKTEAKKIGISFTDNGIGSQNQIEHKNKLKNTIIYKINKI